MEFLEIRCRYSQKNTPKRCRSILGGPALDVIYNHDYEKSSYTEVRYCSNCRSWFKITIKSLNAIPVVEPIPENEKVNFKKPEEVFCFVEVHK